MRTAASSSYYLAALRLRLPAAPGGHKYIQRGPSQAVTLRETPSNPSGLVAIAWWVNWAWDTGMSNCSKPMLSVIVPVWNGADQIGPCLEALRTQDAPVGSFEVIVVDNGSTDTTAEIARTFAGVIVAQEPLPGSYRARNVGVALARGEWLLFTDADCIPHQDWVRSALQASVAHPDAGVIGGRVTTFRADGGNAACADFDDLFSLDQERNIRVAGKCITANWLCRKEVLLTVGGFDADLKSGGDVECSRRITAAGYPIVYAPEMQVRHPARATVSDIVRKQRRVIGGRWQRDKGRPAQLPRWYLGISREQAWFLKRTLASGLPPARKLGLAGIIGRSWVGSMLELTRMAAGAEAPRS